MSGFLELRGLTKAYHEGGREHRVLGGAEATVRRGEFVALLGPSGSGKSTLLNLVGGIDRPDSGAVSVGGTRLTDLPERERTLFRRQHIGFIFQFHNLLPTLTVEENLLLPLELNGRTDAAARRRPRALLERVGLADRADSFPDRLSGGERQRVAVARALVHEPLLVLADEPTGNLDRETGARVLDLLERLIRGEGVTALAVSHSRRVAARADRALELRNGRLVESEADSPSTPRLAEQGA